jgi:predicted dithiol-disulfide oxidoreductase (DUF899 family)
MHDASAADARAIGLAVADSVGHLAHLQARNTSFVLTSMAPLSELDAVEGCE